MSIIDYLNGIDVLLKDINATVDIEQVAIPINGGRPLKYATTVTKQKSIAPLSIESREEDGLTIFKIVNKTTLNYMEMVLKERYEHMDRTGREADVIYMNSTTLREISLACKPWDFMSETNSLSDMTLFGMKVKITRSVPDGEVYLIREEPG